MRLKQSEILKIIESINKFAKSERYELFLYGSRVDDGKLGGDIDLLLITDSENVANFKKHMYLILSEIKKHIDEQKIDIIVASSDAVTMDEFIKHVYSNAIKIYPLL